MKSIGVSISVLNQFCQAIKRYPISHVANLLLCLTECSIREKLHALEIIDLTERLTNIKNTVTRYLQTLDNMELDSIRRRFYIRQQSNIIASMCHKEEKNPYHFDISSEDDDDLAHIIQKLNAANLPEYVVSNVQRDLNRLRKLSASSSDSNVLRTYIEYISELPWSMPHKQKEINISFAKDQLETDHFGIEHVKKRIIEYLSVLKVKSDAKPPIICFVGPPGVGKTTLAKSISAALQRKFHRISLGGVRDEAEIRGHRRTYVGALPGLFINGMRQCGVKNPVFLLDEIDKVVQGTHQGDPAAALLEVLDPAQNSSFKDHFLNIPYDLSQVVFIATANNLDTIPPPLLDRMEVIQLSGYTFEEKLFIAQTHIIPKQIEAHGLFTTGIEISDKVVLYIAEKYTRESGVRELERLIASLCRYKCREYVVLEEAGKLNRFDNVIYVQDIERILGKEIYESDVNDFEEMAGIITGLAYSGSGNGGTMVIEANVMPGNGNLKLTGSLGDVIKESAQIAVSWIKANAFALKLTSSPKDDIFKDLDLHIHLPSGAIPKDGPSAGITIATCIMSLLSGISVSRSTAMTGEVTLRGQVRPVGGIKEKVISAHRAGIKKIILPVANRRDVQHEIPASIQKSISFIYCKSMWDVIEAAFEHTSLRCEQRYTSSL
ncbi:ATP-dependent protease La [Rhizopus delemar RA 99-880]|uniref:ATP-dependent protease La n=3 Tax=Rhizopus TaxID=4842 RepID=I1BWW4_RHIO9|nr:ATP-dependent protease La [Rhizopus delemar RA 99-880]|eukprot:EIE80694.1 ATP-dependent protease La [Rhizopus delemar RA 99-880]